MKMRGRGKTPRPIISAPIGPVKTSRGADFVRSERLTIVDTLKDCEKGTATSECDTSVSIQTSRRVSASFNSSGPLSSTSTVASSDIIATPTIQHPSKPQSPKRSRKSFLATASIPKPFKSVSAKSVFSKSSTHLLDENVPPPPSRNDLDTHVRPRQPRIASKLPKSRTMNALQELKSSISRPSLGLRSMNTASRGSSSRKLSSSSTTTTKTTTPFTSTNSSKAGFPHTSVPSQDQRSPLCAPEMPPTQISAAQPSAYWSGRFVALHDRFSMENLKSHASKGAETDEMQRAGQGHAPAENTYSNLYKRTAHLPHSTTMSALKSMPNDPVVLAVTEDDARCRRVFTHLNSLCTTSDARRSLYAWQQAYARRHDRACLLPEGGSMEDRSIMAKIFGTGPANKPANKSERRSLNALRQATAARASKRALSGTSATPTRAKRLTLS